MSPVQRHPYAAADMEIAANPMKITPSKNDIDCC
jgi:hypothetical protein